MKEKKIELMKKIYEQSADKISRSYQVTLDYDSDGRAVMTMPYGELMRNPVGMISGTAISYLIDYCAWFSAAVHFDHWVATTNFRVDFLTSVKEEGLKAVANVVQTTQRSATVYIEVISDSGKKVAIGIAAFARTSIPIDPTASSD